MVQDGLDFSNVEPICPNCQKVLYRNNIKSTWFSNCRYKIVGMKPNEDGVPEKTKKEGIVEQLLHIPPDENSTIIYSVTFYTFPRESPL